jgi:hypothetical protein
MLVQCQYYNTPNFINNLLHNCYSDNLMKHPQTLHNYHLFTPIIKQFDDMVIL